MAERGVGVRGVGMESSTATKVKRDAGFAESTPQRHGTAAHSTAAQRQAAQHCTGQHSTAKHSTPQPRIERTSRPDKGHPIGPLRTGPNAGGIAHARWGEGWVGKGGRNGRQHGSGSRAKGQSARTGGAMWSVRLALCK